MNRFYYYFPLLFMLISTVIYIPAILIESRFHGAITAILIAIFIGSLLAYLFYRGMRLFPGLGIPEVLKAYLPAYIRSSLLALLGMIWFAAGSIMIIAFSRITVNFLTPHIPLLHLVLCYILIAIWTATLSSSAIMFVMEIILLIALPIQAFIFYKAFRSHTFDWNEVLVMSDYLLDMPSWNTLSAATFLFSGYISILLFNRLLTGNQRLSHFWIIPASGIFFGFNLFFIPIGLHGTEAVSTYMNIWMNTADSLRMQFGLIERVLFLYLFMLMGLALIFITMSWHIGTELVRSIFPVQPRYLRWIIVGIIGAATLLYAHYSNELQFYSTIKRWLTLRLAMEFVMVTLILILGRRLKKHA